MKELEQAIREYLTERGWDHLRPSDLAKSISIEAAELLEPFQWHDATAEQVKANPETLREVTEELADVFIYALDMAVTLDLDPQQIVLDKLAKVKAKYPAELVRRDSNSHLEHDAHGSAYLQLKQQARHGK